MSPARQAGATGKETPLEPARNQRLTQLFWIGGATDSGKSTVAQNLAARHNLAVFLYDREDARQVEKLAQSVPEIHQFLVSSMDERWVQPTPQAMLDFLLLSFPHRFPLVLESLLEAPGDRPILVEGFGLLPRLVQSVLSSPFQAIWLVPTREFKWESMLRRNKPSFAAMVSDPEKARRNLFERDMLLADFYRKDVPSRGLTLLEVDGSCSPEEMTDRIEAHFARFNPTLFL